MLKYDVKLQLDDSVHAIHLDVYQRVISETACSEEEIIRQARLQFQRWAEKQGDDWRIIVARIPFVTITDTQIEVVN